MKLFLFFTLTVISVTSSLAQYSESIVSDRPGQGNSPLTVGKGVIQLQSGFGYNSFFYEPYRSPSRFESLSEDYLQLDNVIRLGIFERFELSTNLAYKYLVTNVIDEYGRNWEEITYGPSRASLWGRYHLLKGDKWKPTLGIQSGLNLLRLPNHSMNNTFLTIALNGTINLSEKISVLTNIGMTNLWEDISYVYGFYVLNIGYQIYPKLSLFAETYGELFEDETTNKFDWGIAYLVNKNLQLDLFGGYKRYPASRQIEWLLKQELFLNLGVSWRINALR